MSEKKITVSEQLKRYPSKWQTFLIEILCLVAIVLLTIKTANVNGINEKGLLMAKNILLGLLKPDFSFMFDLGKNGLLFLLVETLGIAFLGTVFGFILSIPLAFLCSGNIAPKWVNNICLFIISIIRAFPSFMYAIMFVKTVGMGAFAGVLTMMVGSIGMLSKLIMETIEDLNPGIIEALDAAGCTTFEKIRYGIIPQLSSNIVSIVLYRLDINVKNATVLGLVGAGGIGSKLIHNIGAGMWSTVSTMLIGLVIMVLVIEYFSTKIRRKLAVGE